MRCFISRACVRTLGYEYTGMRTRAFHIDVVALARTGASVFVGAFRPTMSLIFPYR